MMTSPSAALRSKWLEALLPNVAFDGWTEAAARQAAISAELSEGEQALAAPNGIHDLIETFFDEAEQSAAQALLAADFTDLGVRDKVAMGVKLWLDALAPNKEAARRAAARGFLPWAAGDAMQRTWSVADMVWTGIGDTSTDYNKYSKRGLLAATIPLIFMRWLDETDDDALEAYIQRRLTGAMRFGQMGGRLVKPVLDIFERVRPI